MNTSLNNNNEFWRKTAACLTTFYVSFCFGYFLKALSIRNVFLRRVMSFLDSAGKPSFPMEKNWDIFRRLPFSCLSVCNWEAVTLHCFWQKPWGRLLEQFILSMDGTTLKSFRNSQHIAQRDEMVLLLLLLFSPRLDVRFITEHNLGIWEHSERPWKVRTCLLPRGSQMRPSFHSIAVRNETRSYLVFKFIFFKLGEAPLLWDAELLVAKGIELGARQGLNHLFFILQLGTDELDDLVDVNPDHCALGLPKDTTHTCLGPRPRTALRLGPWRASRKLSWRSFRVTGCARAPKGCCLHQCTPGRHGVFLFLFLVWLFFLRHGFSV